MLIFTDPDVGEKRGYHDGWLEEEDEHGLIFEYTGHGAGDPTFEGRDGNGNRAILHHVDNQRALLVFKADGKVPGSGTSASAIWGGLNSTETSRTSCVRLPTRTTSCDG